MRVTHVLVACGLMVSFVLATSRVSWAEEPLGAIVRAEQIGNVSSATVGGNDFAVGGLGITSQPSLLGSNSTLRSDGLPLAPFSLGSGKPIGAPLPAKVVNGASEDYFVLSLGSDHSLMTNEAPALVPGSSGQIVRHVENRPTPAANLDSAPFLTSSTNSSATQLIVVGGSNETLNPAVSQAFDAGSLFPSDTSTKGQNWVRGEQSR